VIIHAAQAMGRERVALTLVDDAHPAPEQLIAAARDRSFRCDGADFYPGARIDAPADYAAWLETVLAAVLGGGARVRRCTFAIATTPPADLVPLQRIPHFDDPDPAMIAIVHYLCDAPHRGTQFYRHRATGYETIDAARKPAWRQALVQDRLRHGLPDAGYAAGDTATFTRIGAAELRFNRLEIYPANSLHAGDIGESWSNHDPGEARLTVTSLAGVGPC